VHKANLGSQLSIFDTALARTSSPGRPQTTRQNERPCPNEFTRAPSNDPPERPTQTTRPNEFTRAPSNEPARTTHPNDPPERPKRPARTTHPNDPPKRVHTGALKRPARTTETNRQGRAGQTSCTNVHKANLGSQLSIFDTALARTSSPGRPQTTRPNHRNEATRESRANEFTACALK
jgi:hypothetical protein